MKPNKQLPIRIEAARKRYVWKQKTCCPEEQHIVDAAEASLDALRQPLLDELEQAANYAATLRETAKLMGW